MLFFVNLYMQNIIKDLEQIIAEYTPQLQQLSESDSSFKSSPSKWSDKECLGHLIDSAQSNIRRFVVAQYEDKPHIVYAQEKWVIASDYQNYPLKDLIDLWTLLNKHIVIILKKMPGEMYGRKVLTGDVHSIRWLAEDYNKHLLHHLHQVLHLEPLPYS